jgi:hypothetical protein
LMMSPPKSHYQSLERRFNENLSMKAGQDPG